MYSGVTSAVYNVCHIWIHRRRGARRRSCRRRNSAGATEAASADVLKEREAPVPGAITTTKSKRRNRRCRRGRNHAAEKERWESPVSDNTEKTHTHVQGGLHDTAISKPENDNEGAILTKGDSPQKEGCCLEAHLGDGLVQTTSKQILNSNEKRKKNFQPGNKEVQVSTEDGAGGSSHTRDNSVVEIKPARIKFFEKSSVSCSRSNCSTLGNTNINMDHQNEDPECPEVKNTDLARNSEEQDQKRISPNRSSLQNSEECKENDNGSSLNSSSLKDEKKKRKKRKKGIKNNNRNTNTSQDSPLPTGTATSDLMTMVAENNTPGLKRMGLGGKQNQNDVAMTKSFAVDNAMMTEGKSVNVDGTIEKKYGVVQPCSFEEKETENIAKLLGSCTLDSNKVTSTNVSLMPLQGVEEKETENVAKLLGSCMLDCNKVTSSNVSLMPLQGVIVGPNANTNCLHSTSEEKVCQIAVGEGFTKPFGVVSRPYSSEDNLISRSAKHTREAILRPSFISGVIENALKILPRDDQSYRLDPFNEGANFFQLGNPASNGGSDVRHGINILESGAMGNSEYELGRSYLECAITERNKLQEKEVVFLSTDHNINCISPSSSAKAYKEKLKIAFSPRRSLTGFQKKKLLILDLNGLLADINQDYHNAHMADAKVRGKLVFRRPYCGDFLNFCIQNFDLGIWSSRKRENVDSVIDILMRDFKPYLLFCWDMSKCTFTGRKTLENMHKPLVLKELRKLWNKEEPGLPWEEGDFSPSNTLLVDDSPYKALRNPPHTAIFPHPYHYLNWNDNSLGPGGDLRVYLENLAVAEDVERYVRNNPFGQPFITQSDPHWNFYSQIADKGNVSLTCRA